MVRHVSTFCHDTVKKWNSLLSLVALSNSVNYFRSRLNDSWKEHVLKFNAHCFYFSCCPNIQCVDVFFMKSMGWCMSLTYSISANVYKKTISFIIFIIKINYCQTFFSQGFNNCHCPTFIVHNF